jgi:hypothetical protein
LSFEVEVVSNSKKQSRKRSGHRKKKSTHDEQAEETVNPLSAPSEVYDEQSSTDPVAGSALVSNVEAGAEDSSAASVSSEAERDAHESTENPLSFEVEASKTKSGKRSRKRKGRKKDKLSLSLKPSEREETVDPVGAPSDVDGEQSHQQDSSQPTNGAALTLRATPSSSAAVPSEAEWEEKYSDEHKRPYWSNTMTGERTWTKPVAGGAAAASPPRAEVASPRLAAAVANGDVGATPDGSSDWEEKYSEEHKRAYWSNKKTGERTWTKPVAGGAAAASPRLVAAGGAAATDGSSDWEEKYSEVHKRAYWSNKKTGESTWTKPVAAMDSSR